MLINSKAVMGHSILWLFFPGNTGWFQRECEEALLSPISLHILQGAKQQLYVVMAIHFSFFLLVFNVDMKTDLAWFLQRNISCQIFQDLKNTSHTCNSVYKKTKNMSVFTYLTFTEVFFFFSWLNMKNKTKWPVLAFFLYEQQFESCFIQFGAVFS